MLGNSVTQFLTVAADLWCRWLPLADTNNSTNTYTTRLLDNDPVLCACATAVHQPSLQATAARVAVSEKGREEGEERECGVFTEKYKKASHSFRAEFCSLDVPRCV